MLAKIAAVQPNVGSAMHAPKLEPDPLALPVAWDSYAAPIPARAGEDMEETAEIVPLTIDARVGNRLVRRDSDPLGIPRSRDLDLPWKRDAWLIPMFCLAHILRIHTEVPLPRQVERPAEPLP
ncbi:MAG: hypothetical protein NZ602_10790 [Thermoguttaceae bacterium]|nr:hypothetical protein [Thermoguttaceae bacterium]MDW8037547.1 hypothetical protein [Thermoguttaceae bacterium]